MRNTGKPHRLLLTICALSITASLGGLGCAGTSDTTQAGDASNTEEVGGTDETLASALVDCGLQHELEFGGVYITSTIDDFNALGYEYGDSVDIRFSNGYDLLDQPYYNGYYVPSGESLLVAYPGYPYIKACISFGGDLWDIAGLTEDDTATITLNEHGKYADVQSARDIHYDDDRDLYESDEAFANFRDVTVGEIAPNTLYRSASPADNQHKRATYVDELMRSAGIRCDLDLADDDAKIEGYLADDSFDTPYFRSLYEEGNVIPLALNVNYGSEEFQQKLVSGLVDMLQHEGPYLVHCTEGKDRTGFVCMLLEALCGASYDEIEADFMVTYDNYYGISKESDADRYAITVESMLDPMVQVLEGEGADVRTADLKAGAEAYLLGGGMTDEQVSALVARLTDALA